MERYYLLNRMFKGMEIIYDKKLLDKVAGVVEEEMSYVYEEKELTG